MNIAERFYAKVDRGDSDACWLWRGCRNRKGYGQLRIIGKAYLAHRFAYEYVVGPIPDGLCVLHRCDTPACVNTRHLFLGTTLDNNRDMDAKGRADRQGQAKLDAARAAQIRATTGSHRAIAEAFGVHQTTVTRIKNERIWKAGTV